MLRTLVTTFVCAFCVAQASPPLALTAVNTWKASPAAMVETGCPAYVIPLEQPYIPKATPSGPSSVVVPHVANSCASLGIFWLFSLPRDIVTCKLVFPTRQVLNGQDTACTFDRTTNTFTYVLTPPGQNLVRKALAAFK